MTDLTARNELYTLFTDIWGDVLSGPTALLGYIPEVRYRGIEKPDKPLSNKFWVMNSLEIIDQYQSCLGGGANGSKKSWTTEGMFISQLFCPKNENNGVTNGWKLSIIIRDVFRTKNTSGNIWFKNQKIVPLEDEAHYHRFNVITEYQYDEKA